MERIPNLLKKIQDVYEQKGVKQPIDIDLMLDYTRVLYADLLEWRQSFIPTEPEVPDTEELSASVQEAAVFPEQEPEPPEPVIVDDLPQVQVPVPDEDPLVEEPEDAAAVRVPDDVPQSIADIVDEADEPLLPEELVAWPEAVVSEAADELETTVFSEIHFELPTVQDDASKSIPADALAQRPARDVRSYIGINDKYQFMNELFGNNKSAYEETLDHINSLSDLKDAERWVTQELVRKYNWAEDDVTVQSLMATIKKYFV